MSLSDWSSNSAKSPVDRSSSVLLVDAMLARHASAVDIPAWTIIVAAGSGTRFGGPKLFELLNGRTVLEHSISTALAVTDSVVVVLSEEAHHELAAGLESPQRRIVVGGATRSESVRAGLAAVPSEVRFIAVHDGARPLAGVELYERAFAAIESGADGAVPAVPVMDTIRDVSGAPVDRAKLRAVQTPQMFRSEVLRRAHEQEPDATDDASLAEAVGAQIALVDGDPRNLKITERLDLEIIRGIAAQ